MKKDSPEKKEFELKLKELFMISSSSGLTLSICRKCGSNVGALSHLTHLQSFHREIYDELLPYFKKIDDRSDILY